MYKKIFTKAGLTPTQAEIMEYLFKTKEEKASNIAKKLKKSRAIIYKDLEEMVGLNIVEKKEKPNGVSFFRVGHPTHMEKFFDKKENEIKKDRELFNNYLPDMVSAYNLLSNKPGVRYFEGLKGLEEVINDTLKSKTEIYTFVDHAAINGETQKLNKNYSQKRLKANIKKKILVADTEENRKYFMSYSHDLTEIKFIQKDFCPFKSAIQIYDNKVSFQTLDEKGQIAIIIEDKNIYQMQKIMFEYIWNTL